MRFHTTAYKELFAHGLEMRYYWLLSILLAMIFAWSHTQSPLFYSNQNQYLLHAAGKVPWGHLSQDWLANTRDPTPVFSGGATILWKTVGVWSFQVIYFLALMGYFLLLSHLVRVVFSLKWHFGWACVFILLHAGILRFASDRLIGVDYPWFFHCGLASQYILGPGLQPSVFGVVVLAGIVAYSSGRTLLAVFLVAAANLVHSTYLLAAAMLTAGFILDHLLRRDWKTALKCGGLALLTVSPIVIFNWLKFGPADAELFRQSQAIIAWDRIPHHTLLSRWFDWIAAVQVGWILLAVAFLYRTRLFVPLLTTCILAAVGTLMVLQTHHATLALMFPWRISAVLVPIATAINLGFLFSKIRCAPTWCQGIGIVILLFTTGGAFYLYYNKLAYREPEGENAAMDYVASTATAEDLYLVPARFAKPTTKRGVFSSTFSRGPKRDAIVYFEMARFRLTTGARLFVDFKSIPYYADDIIEWKRRVERCVRWFGQSSWNEELIAEMKQEGITHVVVPTQTPITSSHLELKFEGGTYRVYQLK
ncbi:MAG: DUF6798 domain-containing protein [Zavarzinella sp.]